MRNNEEQYRQEWATLTGKNPSEIYVPEALRDREQDVKVEPVTPEPHDFEPHENWKV